MQKILLVQLLLNGIIVYASTNDFTSANNLFAASIYREILKDNPGNFLASPFSAETVLSLAAIGARNETAEELRKALHLPDNKKDVISAVKVLLPELQNNQEYKLQTANKIYLQQNYSIKTNFQNIATSVFNSGVENVNFVKNVEASNKINRWVEEQTANNIHDLVEPDALNSYTRVVLVNALYFQANWRKKFESFLTKDRTFYQNGKQAVRVTTMHDHNGRYNYHYNSDLKAKFLEVPFIDETVTMTFVLPDSNEGLYTLENRIDQVLEPQPFIEDAVVIGIPTFKIESKLDFKKILTKLGVTKAFNYDEANFTGISDEQLVINKIIQKTFINVGEEGVEAAAATYADLGYRMGHGLPLPGIKTFLANHPFLFYLKVKDLILFVGRVTTLPAEQYY